MQMANTINNVNTSKNLDFFKELMVLILKDANITQQQKIQVEQYVVNNCKE